MGGGGQRTEPGEPGSRAAGVYSWEEVQSHCTKTDMWVVIDRKVYNVTQWAKRHPGGFRVLFHYAGEDATVNTSFFTINIIYSFYDSGCGTCLHSGQVLQLSKLHTTTK